MIGGIVGRSEILQRTVFVGFSHREFQEIESIVYGEILTHILQIEGIKSGLRFAQCHFSVRHLQHFSRMMGTDAQGLSAIYNIFSQSEG